MGFMVVLGSDDGLIASGERTFISGSLRPRRCVMNAVLGFLVSKFVWSFHNLMDGITVVMPSNTMRAFYNYGITAARSRITEAITTLSSSVRDLSDHQAIGTCMGRYGTASELLRRGIVRVTASAKEDPSSRCPIALSIWVQPSTLSSSFQLPDSSPGSSPSSSPVRMRQEAGERRGHQFLPACAFEQPTSLLTQYL